MAARKKTPDQPTVIAPAESAAPSAEGVLGDTQAVVREALKNGDHRTALKGLEMLGKHFGLFGDRSEPAATSGQVLIYKIPDNGRGQPLTDCD